MVRCEKLRWYKMDPRWISWLVVPEYSRVYLNDAPVGKGRQIRIRCGLYNKASRLIPFMAPGMSVSVYVSNIVEEHLKRHGELLKNELECFLYKDSLWKN